MEENSGLSEKTQEILKSVEKESPLGLFRKVFPTGKEVQAACLYMMGINYESDTPFKRVLEEFGSSIIFGKLWMAICATGQVAVESGFITEKERPFYEICLAILAHKAGKFGNFVPSSSEVNKISKSLITANIDLAKVRKGISSEIKRASIEVDKFLDVRDVYQLDPGAALIEDVIISPTAVSDICGWKVGDPIYNRTLLGHVPKWSTVRYRYWKNEAAKHRQGITKANLKYEVTEENLARMEKGLAPSSL